MKVSAAVDELEARGVALSFEGNRIQFRAPKGAMQEADRILLAAHRDEVLATLRARAKARTDRLPLSYGQQALWMVDSLSPRTSVNNLVCALRFSVPADLETSRGALQLLFDRHAMLRATVHVDDDGGLFQRLAGAADAALEVREARGLNDAALHAAVEAERDRPFDLESGPLLRLVIFRLGESEHLQLLVTHHIVSDGMSMLTLMGEFLLTWFPLRSGHQAELPPLRMTYADYIRAEAELMTSERAEELWRYWREQLSGAPGAVALPFDHPRPSVPSFRGSSIPLQLSDTLTARLVAFARESEATLFTLALTLYGMFLARLSGITDVVVGTSFSERAEANYGVVGDFVNALPVRARLRWNMSLREAVAQQRIVIQDAISSQQYPVQKLIEQLRPERSADASPLFNCFFTLGQFPAHRAFSTLLAGYGDDMEQDGIRLSPFRLAQQPGQFDLTLNLSWSGTALRGTLDYAIDLFDRPTVERLAAEFVAFLERSVADPNETLLPRAERHRVLETYNDTAVALDSSPFIQQFRASAAAHARRYAVRYGDQSSDYASLERDTDRMARRLTSAGAARGSVVGIFMERSPAMLAALLAVQQTGATYVPLDPAFPAQRLAFMAADSAMALLITDGDRPAWLSADVATVAPALDGRPEIGDAPPLGGPRPEDIAYILYTSGSTGRPNGVRITHAALANFLGSMLSEPGIIGSDTFAAVTTMSFDIAALELFGPLLAGATVDIVPRATAADGAALAARLDQMGATILQATPATWRLLLEAGWRPPPGFRALSAGEALPSEVAQALLARGVELWNLYGPTETTVHSTASRITAADEIDVGRPIANTRVYLLDATDAPVPVGVAASIWIGGAGLAEGYHNRPDLTAERFRPDPFANVPAARMYRTGDMGRWTEDGRLIHLGRSDDQLKLRGFRVEPGEIEAVLAAHPDVRRAVVVARSVRDDVRLAAYLVYEPGAAPTTGELRNHVRAQLPEYMVPSIFVELAEVPLTPNGKIDRRALPNPFLGATAQPSDSALRGCLEQRFARIWQDVLGVGGIGADDNFFSVGGHSLLALRVAKILERETGFRIAPRMLFFHTLRQIVAALEKAGPASEPIPPKRRWLSRSRVSAR